MSSINPYDPGFALHSPPPLPEAASLPPYSFSGAFERGWLVFKQNYGPLLGASALVVGASLIDNVVQAVIKETYPALTLLWNLPFTLLVLLPLGAGLTLVGAGAARRGKARFEDLFLGYRRLGWIILWVLLAGCVTLVGLIPGAAVVLLAWTTGGEQIGLVVMLPVVLVYFGIFICLAPRFMHVPPMLADPYLPQWDVLETARNSWRLTREVWPSLLGLNIVMGLMVFGSLLMLCVGIIFLGYPLMAAISGCAYAMIVEPAALRRQIA